MQHLCVERLTSGFLVTAKYGYNGSHLTRIETFALTTEGSAALAVTALLADKSEPADPAPHG